MSLPSVLHRSARRAAAAVSRDKLLAASVAALALTTAIRGELPEYSVGDLRVLAALFAFLVVMQGLDRSGLPLAVAALARRHSFVPQKLLLVTAVMAALVTNDVALLTVVPFTIAVGEGGSGLLVALEAVVANAASAVSPIGSPQNIFIYFFYKLRPLEFVAAIWPLTAVVVGAALAASWLVRGPRDSRAPRVSVDRGQAAAYGILFVTTAAAVMHLLPEICLAAPVVFAAVADRSSLRVDWRLLATFWAFFGFTDNLAQMLGQLHHAPTHVFWTALLTSQVISNVPAAALLADFTEHWRDLLWGVSVGGFGTIVGSLASVIAYRLYRRQRPSDRRFLPLLHLVNGLALALGVAVYLAVRQ